MSKYLQYLPRVFKEGPADQSGFLGKYLEIFEALLSGGDETLQVTSLEERISQFVNCLDAGLTPVEQGEPIDSPFLSYLARWVALVFDQNWLIDKKRQWLQRIVPLYKKRGTKSGLLEYLNMFVKRQVEIEEPAVGFTIAEHSTIGVDTFIGGAAYYFRVKINFGFPPDEIFDIDTWKNLKKGIKAIVDLEKPAHTYYNLDARTPGIIVAKRSTVGKDTLIWEKSKKI